MDHTSTSASLHLTPEVKPESNTEDYETEIFLPIYCNSLGESNTLKSKEPVVKNDEEYISDQFPQVPLPNDRPEMESFNIFPRYNQIYLKESLPMVKNEENEAVNKFNEQMYNVDLERWEVKNEESFVKAKALESNETRHNEMFMKATLPIVKIEEDEAVDVFGDQMYNVNFEPREVKNEEPIIKGEALEFNETRCEKIYLNQADPLVNIENSKDVNGSLQMDWKIKTEELDIKNEDAESSKISILLCQGDRKSSIIYQKQLFELKNSGESIKAKCNQCAFQTTHKNSLSQHLLRHKKPEEGNKFNCNQCDFETIYKKSLNLHLLNHGIPEEVHTFKCNQCDYKTIQKRNLQVHVHRHKNSEELIVFKCNQCDYQTVYKYYLNKHLLRHKNREANNMFKCDQCDFQTYYQNNFGLHQIRHKNPEEANMYKCYQCDYKTFQKRYLQMHIHRHKNTEEINIFKCDQCGFQTVHKKNLKRHLLKHKNPEDVDTFKCSQCEFQTIYKNSLSLHLLRHKNPEEVTTFKCNQCDYETIEKSYLQMHIRQHINPEEVNVFKCDQYEYQTFYKKYLNEHLLRHKNGEASIKHKNPKEGNIMFNCVQCSFQGINKSALQRHRIKQHTNPDDPNVFKCSQCNYKTFEKRNLRMHIRRYRNPDEIKNRLLCHLAVK